MTIDWKRDILGQLDFYVSVHLLPRLDGLTDDEYFWEPVAGCWTVRPGGEGRLEADWAGPEPTPPPFTTIAWRMAHITVGCFAARTSLFFGDGGVSFDTVELPATATDAIGDLAKAYEEWHDAIAGLDEAGFLAPLGPKGGPYADDPMAGLVLHINREVMHHGAEIGVLRDLYRASGAKDRDSRLVPVG